MRGRLPALLAGAALLALALVVNNYGVPLLPRKEIPLPAAAMVRPPDLPAHVHAVAFTHSEPQRPDVQRSEVLLFDAGARTGPALRDPAELLQIGGERLVHEPGRLLFSTKHNEDPARTGRAFHLSSPRLYSRAVGLAAAAVLLLALAGLVVAGRLRPPPARAPGEAAWPRHAAGAALLFFAGLYANTGTMTPYAITTFPHESGGYLYNPDHAHFQALHAFVSGGDRGVWDGAILLRRILYPALAAPFVALGGFEVGGTVASLTFNLLGFVGVAAWMRRRFGTRGAAAGVWVLALYPGAAYWAGLPYLYALIAPLSLALLLALEELAAARGRRLALLSLGLGVAYLAYDFVAFFAPATLLLLLWRRRPGAALVSLPLQLLPLAAWVAVLRWGFGQDLGNSNTGTYGAILAAYAQPEAWRLVLARLPSLPETALVVFFGANFTFLPALFVGALVLDRVTSRTGLTAAEGALLLAAAALFVFNHLAPEYPGWQMRGSWIARIYQPVFPVFVFFVARWWAGLPRLGPAARAGLLALVAATGAGNALIVFGPALGNPGRVSEIAFYRFYDHQQHHWVYELHNLARHGRRPLGF
jgi:hypothetical protein